eukprot:TRINITY_DN37889_c0_g1_i1.p1 TRINITY_DN37889_c0_g1~~TRINITY_DN37889_c0_g1_i1.p1  ORF type:complete len:645 (+),score=121.40 TRINITY_DN37889_c0_g1_i1:77-2011(+)
MAPLGGGFETAAAGLLGGLQKALAIEHDRVVGERERELKRVIAELRSESLELRERLFEACRAASPHAFGASTLKASAASTAVDSPGSPSAATLATAAATAAAAAKPASKASPCSDKAEVDNTNAVAAPPAPLPPAPPRLQSPVATSSSLLPNVSSDETESRGPEAAAAPTKVETEAERNSDLAQGESCIADADGRAAIELQGDNCSKSEVAVVFATNSASGLQLPIGPFAGVDSADDVRPNCAPGELECEGPAKDTVEGEGDPCVVCSPMSVKAPAEVLSPTASESAAAGAMLAPTASETSAGVATACGDSPSPQTPSASEAAASGGVLAPAANETSAAVAIACDDSPSPEILSGSESATASAVLAPKASETSAFAVTACGDSPSPQTPSASSVLADILRPPKVPVQSLEGTIGKQDCPAVGSSESTLVSCGVLQDLAVEASAASDAHASEVHQTQPLIAAVARASLTPTPPARGSPSAPSTPRQRPLAARAPSRSSAESPPPQAPAAAATAAPSALPTSSVEACTPAQASSLVGVAYPASQRGPALEASPLRPPSPSAPSAPAVAPAPRTVVQELLRAQGAARRGASGSHGTSCSGTAAARPQRASPFRRGVGAAAAAVPAASAARGAAALVGDGRSGGTALA